MVLCGVEKPTHMKNKPTAIAITAPSASGKSLIIKLLFESGLNLAFSISATTRAPRPGEKHGVDYYFMSVEEFMERKDRDEFLETAEVYEGVFYGTLKSEVERLAAKGKILVFDIDVEGAKNLKRQLGSKLLTIFIQVPSHIREKRLKERKTECAEEIEQRRAKAEVEIQEMYSFDRIVSNAANDMGKLATWLCTLTIERAVLAA